MEMCVPGITTKPKCTWVKLPWVSRLDCLHNFASTRSLVPQALIGLMPGMTLAPAKQCKYQDDAGIDSIFIPALHGHAALASCII